MKITVLLSPGLHPLSGKPVLPRLEAQAIALGKSLGGVLSGLAAASCPDGVADALGHGLAQLDLIATTEGEDPMPLLAAALAEDGPKLVLAGRRSQGGEESGLVPYALAKALGLGVVADAVAIEPGTEPGTLSILQALPKGARRRVVARLPMVVTVHPAAPPALPYAYGAARRGTLRARRVQAAPGAPDAAPGLFEERAYRKRPKLMRGAGTGGSAAERLRAATEAGGAGGRVLTDLSPEQAARTILDHLAGLGILR
ncbi:adenine nucleotide alpha hydrolase family protein [Mangrovibrevibacter kandeliae]|uniref:electron transfer flavoprotein subunit beta n=1 Tax=Mangrovibrevibacter kandeliae TaxID=2968473 RepID=UPI002118F68A|nr:MULTISPECIES: electron transfer flavoprotein subunit beta [unclassified Aurantimonas]MCQ8780755.1 electron transfer flavoprotein subunit beta [Aurantimonas sp. CSK15Z-1]MCW4113538.1 electron transfer flavoprotein subunit beta [Aurantimonas sp. MSK8Z-1]